MQVDGEIVSKIGPGLLCLIGVRDGDTERDAEWLARKILTMRVFPDEGKARAWDLNVSLDSSAAAWSLCSDGLNS